MVSVVQSPALRRIVTLIFFALLTGVVTYPRFDMQDRGIVTRYTTKLGGEFRAKDGKEYTGLSLDVEQYLKMVAYFRHPSASAGKELVSPFCYRVLTPILASLLPWNEMTSVNIVNVLALLAALVFLERLLGKLQISRRVIRLSLLLFVVSFPTFYYGAIGYVDPVLIAFLMAALYLAVSGNRVLLIGTVLLGTFAKEGMAVILPALLAYAVFSEPQKRRSRAILFLCAAAAYGAAMVAVRWFFADKQAYMWIPSLHVLAVNAARPRLYVNLLLSFGIPGVLGFWAIVSTLRKGMPRGPLFPALAAGFATSLLYFVYGAITVPADGRYLWPLCVFAIPLAAMWMEGRRLPKLFFRGRWVCRATSVD